jgi:tRNA G46 methylase TrmB
MNAIKNKTKTKRRRIGRVIRTTRKNFVSKLKSLYPSCKHDSNNDRSSYIGHNITYGEMNYDGMKVLYTYLQTINPEINTFIDIGSGRGKLCLYLASLPKIKKCIGIELVKSRCDDAIELKSRLSSAFADKVEFICGDIFSIDLSERSGTDAKVFVWFSNLCFNQETVDEVFEKIVNELPKGSILCCSKKTISENPRITFIETVPIEMSWNKESNVHIYQI